MKPKVLVTGGAGFIGSHTVVELALAGFEPIILDNLYNSSEKALEGIEKILGCPTPFYNLDLLDFNQLQALLDSLDLSGTIHFAAYKSVGESVAEPLKYYRNNINSLINLLQILKKGSKNFIFSSSCTVYGQPDRLPVDETAPFQIAESPYGYTKQVCEQILKDLAKVEPFKVISLRYFNPVGAHPSGFIGELPLGIPQNLVPFLTQTAMGKRSSLTVYGDDYPTSDGSCVRDYIHVVDLAKAHVKALEFLLKLPKGSNPKLSLVKGEEDKREEYKNKGFFDTFNLGTGKGNTVLEVIHAFEKVNHIKVPYKIGPRRAGDVVQIWGDVQKAEQILGWKSERNLENMMETAWNWEKKLEK